MVSNNQQKIRGTNSMINLLIVPILDDNRAAHLFKLGNRVSGYCTDRVVNGLKKSPKNRESQ